MRRYGILAALLLVLAAVPASAQTILGTTATGGAASTLVEIDPATGALLNTIGPVGYAVNGLSWDASSGTLWATTSTYDPTFPNGLITIDPLTGAGTPVGSGVGQLVNLVASNSTGQVYGWTEASDDLVLWNTVAGTITVYPDPLGTGRHGLAFDASDVLYLVNSGGDVYTVNTTNGATTNIGGIALAAYAHHGDFDPTSGLYYGIDQAGSGPKNFVVADLSTFSVVNTIPTVADLHTLTFFGGALVAVDVPTVSPWGAALMTLLLVVAGGVLLRRFM